MLALSNSGTAFLKSATAIGLIYAGYTMVAATMFAWADRGKEYLEGDRVAQIQLEVKVSKAVLILGTFAPWAPFQFSLRRLPDLDVTRWSPPVSQRG